MRRAVFGSATYGEIYCGEEGCSLKQDIHDDHTEHGVAELSETLCAAMLCVVWG